MGATCSGRPRRSAGTHAQPARGRHGVGRRSRSRGRREAARECASGFPGNVCRVGWRGL